MKYKNYKNSYTKEDKIYSRENMLDMSLREMITRKDELLAQTKVLGIPEEEELRNSENAVYVEAYTRDDGTEVKAHWRSKPNGDSSDNFGVLTGYAAKIDREKESKNIKDLPKNNDEFFEKERSNTISWLMQFNEEKNKNNPDAKLFMDIALVHPKNVPSTQDYQFVSSQQTKELNKKYNLEGNKAIPSHYDGFEFSENSPTAQALNNSAELKSEIFNETKNYNPQTKTFKSDKLEIEFKKDKNLQYSFGHMTILEPKLEGGYMTGLGYDKYNFEAMYGHKFKNVSQETKNLNNSAKFLQSTTMLKNYFVFVPIRIKI